jgi:hypothetical protein
MLFEVCPNIIRSGCLSLIYIEALTEAVSTNSIEEADKTYFPSIKELVSFLRKGRPTEQGLNKKPVVQTVNKLAVEKSSYFSNPDKSVLEGNIYSSQGRHI